MLLRIEPLVPHRRLATSHRPPVSFARMERMRRLLLVPATVALLGAVAGSRGFLWR